MARFNLPLGEILTPELCHKMAHFNVPRLMQSLLIYSVEFLIILVIKTSLVQSFLLSNYSSQKGHLFP